MAIEVSATPSDPVRPANDRGTHRSFMLPSSVDVLFLLLAVILPLTASRRLFASDGDLARHLRVGDDILVSHALSFRDQYSFTMQGQPFVPYEWLSEVIFAAVNRLGGLPAIAVLAGLAFGLTYALVVVFLRTSGVDPLLAYLIGLTGAALGVIHWLARPHLFTPLGAICLVWLLERGSRRAAWLVVPLFVVWANLHGGFLFGFIVIAGYLAGDLWEAAAPESRGDWLARARFHGRVLVLAVVASNLNPSGPALFAHVTGYLRNSYLVDHTYEYASPDMHTFTGQLLLATALAMLVCLALQPRRPTFPRLVVLVVAVGFAFYSWRNIPLYAVTGLPLLALEVDAEWRGLSWTHRVRQVFQRGEERRIAGRWAAVGGTAMVLLGLGHGGLAGAQLIPDHFAADVFPIAAVQQARAAGLSGHLFNDFIWGGYILYAWPEQRVFVDGQTDFYGEALMREFTQIETLQPGWQEALRARDVSLVIVPPDAPLARELERDPAWRTWYADEVAVVLRRQT